MSRILELLNLIPSAESTDYVDNRKQFHLFNLVTEQRHPKTWNLSFAAQSNTQAALRMLLSVDRDIQRRIAELRHESELLEQAVDSIVKAVENGRKIFFYGCGATGRLAKEMESTLWRPFWRRAKRLSSWSKLSPHLPGNIEDLLVGEMTGGDRALVSSLEGFEDLQLIGKLQLKDHDISPGDVVFCVTEGGETSSVIGAILAAVEQYGELDEQRIQRARRNLYFIYNNPDEVLRSFQRSASVLDCPAITRINLTTGPQAITGSTRMQATTIETFVLGAILEEAVARVIRPHLGAADLGDLGYFRGNDGLTDRLASFDRIKRAVDASVPDLAKFTDLEASIYRSGAFATYFAGKALITVFIDGTERSPTFRLYPLDTVDEQERKSWFQIWTAASDAPDAWSKFLGRRFRGLAPRLYRRPFEQEVLDPYLRDAALRGLANAGNEQELAYDFSFSAPNIERRKPADGDLGVIVAVDDEARQLEVDGSSFNRFMKLLLDRRAHPVVVLVAGQDQGEATDGLRAWTQDAVVVRVILDSDEDPLSLRRQIALKMLLNAHSTAVMAAVDRVVGNTMTSVTPSNLKLIGRASYLVMCHVNDILGQPEWLKDYGQAEPLEFAEANAVVMDAVRYVHSADIGQTAEVALSIIRIVEALSRGSAVSWSEAQEILNREGLPGYLLRRGRTAPATRIQPE